MSSDRWWKYSMTLRIHTNRDCIDITTAASVSIKEIILNIEGIKYKGKGYIIPPRKLVKESLIKII